MLHTRLQLASTVQYPERRLLLSVMPFSAYNDLFLSSYLSTDKNDVKPLLSSTTFTVAWRLSTASAVKSTINVQPVFKKGCTNDPSNYRPISLTSTCCKAMERIVNNHLLNYLLENQLITRHQHGFIRKNQHVLIC